MSTRAGADCAIPFDSQEQIPPQEPLRLLGHLYLEAGLAPEAAWDAALADYRCGFESFAISLT